MKKFISAFILMLSCALFNIAVGQRGFFKLGDIDGESVDKDHKDWIIISGFKQEAEASAPSSGVRSSAISKRQYSPILIRKRIDKSTPLLYLNFSEGTQLREAIIELEDLDRAGSFYRVVLSDVIISGVNTKAVCEPDCSTVEEVSLNFSKIEWFYKTQSGQIIRAGYDISKGKKV